MLQNSDIVYHVLHLYIIEEADINCTLTYCLFIADVIVSQHKGPGHSLLDLLLLHGPYFTARSFYITYTTYSQEMQ